MKEDLYIRRLNKNIENSKLKLRAMLLIKRNELDKAGERLSDDDQELETLLLKQTFKN